MMGRKGFSLYAEQTVNRLVEGARNFNRSYCQIWCMAGLNQAAFLPIFLSSMPSMNRTSVTTSGS